MGNPQLDATQRAEILDKIRAERATLSANRIQKATSANGSRTYDQSVVYQDGIAGQTDKNGMFVPLPQQTKRPTSAEDAFKSDPKLADKYFQDAKAIVTEDGEIPYDEDARKKRWIWQGSCTSRITMWHANACTGNVWSVAGSSHSSATAIDPENRLGIPTTAPLMEVIENRTVQRNRFFLHRHRRKNWPPPPVQENASPSTTNNSR